MFNRIWANAKAWLKKKAYEAAVEKFKKRLVAASIDPETVLIQKGADLQVSQSAFMKAALELGEPQAEVLVGEYLVFVKQLHTIRNF